MQNLEKLQEEHGDYNNTITELDKRYTSIKPTRSILVRVFAKMPAISDSGLLIDQPIKVPIQTINGRGIQGYTQSPYPVTDKAIVVSVPEAYEYTYKQKDIVQLGDIPVRCPFPGDSTVVPMYAYTHPDYPNEFVPTKVTDKDYGYYLVPENLIVAFLEKQPRQDQLEEVQTDIPGLPSHG